jgi:hypothetical protein
MLALEKNLKQLRKVGGSHLEIISEGKSRDNEYPEKESGKDPNKEKSSYSAITAL